LSWLLLIPFFNVIWIWVLLIQTSRSFDTIHLAGRSSLHLAIIVCSLFSILFIMLDPNWAWAIALLVFIPYKKRLLKANVAATSQQNGRTGACT
jgi:hypothetical protein